MMQQTIKIVQENKDWIPIVVAVITLVGMIATAYIQKKKRKWDD